MSKVYLSLYLGLFKDFFLLPFSFFDSNKILQVVDLVLDPFLY